MKDTLAVIAPEDPAWLLFKTSAAILRLQVELLAGIDDFIRRDLPASDTVVVVDADATATASPASPPPSSGTARRGSSPSRSSCRRANG